MLSTEPLLVILGIATIAVAVLLILLLPALFGHGPLAARVLTITRRRDLMTQTRARIPTGVVSPTAPAVQLLARKRRSQVDSDAGRLEHASAEELDEVLHGAFGAESVNRAIRVLSYAFVLVVLGIVSISQLWEPVQGQIYATLAVGGVFVLVVHEMLPATGLGTPRLILEGTAAVVFLTILVLLTGKTSSPFFFIIGPVMGGLALVAAAPATLVLVLEAILACMIVALSGPTTGDAARYSMALVAVNLASIVALSWAGMAIAQILKRTKEAAIRLSTVDSLTDLCNRGYFFNAVDREIQRSRRFGRGFCLLMMDLDGLKPINDLYGHYNGDLVLRGVAHVIKTGLRGLDVPARYGGDEFVALLPETDSTGAFVVAEKIRMGVSEMVIEGAGQQVRTSLSIGVVVYPDDGHTADELMIAADEAMYASKRLGKNRVVGYADPGDASAPFVAPRRQVVSTPGFRPIPRDVEDYPEKGIRDRFVLGDRSRDRTPPEREDWDPRDRPGPTAMGPGDTSTWREIDLGPRDISDRGSAG